jgi:hypothetical protein
MVELGRILAYSRARHLTAWRDRAFHLFDDGSVMLTFRKFVCTAVLAAVAVAPLSAQTFTNAMATTPFAATSALNGTARGNNLFGMLVTGTFANGTSFSQAWTSLNASTTGIDVAGLFRLTLGATSNTGSAAFQMTVFGTGNALQSLTLQAAPASAFFDRTFGGATGTAGTSTGGDFRYSGTTDLWNTLVTYSNPVMLGNAAPVGDVFATMRLDFQTSVTGTTAGRNVRFIADMDRANGGQILATPEPSTFALTAIGGLAAIALAARRRRTEARQRS